MKKNSDHTNMGPGTIYSSIQCIGIARQSLFLDEEKTEMFFYRRIFLELKGQLY